MSRTQSVFNLAFSEQPKRRTQSTRLKPSTKTSCNDVVDALQFVQNGSKMIMIEGDNHHTWDLYQVTEDLSSLANSKGQVIFPLCAVESVSMASEISVSQAIDVLGITNVRPEGLEPILFTVTLSGSHSIVFIASCPRDSYIWMRALQALAESARDLDMIPLMVSNRLRSGTFVFGQQMTCGDDEEETEAKMSDGVEILSSKHKVKIPSVLSDEWRYFEQQIDSLDHFVQVFCILDSAQHLALLGHVLRLRNRLNVLESSIHKKNKSCHAFRGWSAWPKLHEQWWLLHADIAVTHLMLADLRVELGMQ